MPWNVSPVSELRLALIHQVITCHLSVAQAARNFGVSRKTASKWLARYREVPDQPLSDQSRKPTSSPKRTPPAIEQAICGVRRQYGWGARKIQAYLAQQGLQVPSPRTVTHVLKRHGYIDTALAEPLDPVQAFERERPHQLWQCDHKGPLEVGRRKVHPFTVIDDHSRYLIACHTCADVSMQPAFDVLWKAFGEFGLPDAILCDNAFGTTFETPKTLSWFDARLIRLGIHPIHGRPYHPQTQGKVEWLHGTLERELWPSIRRDSRDQFQADLDHWRTRVYNTIRPHEALGDRPPVSRFSHSLKPRPTQLPPVEYPTEGLIRKVSTSGDVRWNRHRILAGRGLVGEFVRIEERESEIALFYAWKEYRVIPRPQKLTSHML